MPDRYLTRLSLKDEIKNLGMQLAQAQLDKLNAEAGLYEFEGFDMDDYPGLVGQQNDAEVSLQRATNRVKFWEEKVQTVERLAEAEANLPA